jgi:hypothetical protein
MMSEQTPIRFARWHAWKLLMLTVIAIFYTNFAQGEAVTRANVEHNHGHFTLHANMVIRAPIHQVRAVLTQFDNLPKINSGIKAVQILDHKDNESVRMRIASEVCLLFICRAYQWVQDARLLPSGDIMTRMDPSLSDFQKGWVRYRLRAENQHTRLLMDAELVPDFWFPPIVGTLLIKRKLQHEALETALGVEQLIKRTARLVVIGRHPVYKPAQIHPQNGLWLGSSVIAENR